jgi:hypothetical protein
MLLFVAEEQLRKQECLRGLAAGSPPPLALVHPRLFVQAAARPSITSLRQVLRALPPLVVARLSSGVARLLGLARPR